MTRDTQWADLDFAARYGDGRALLVELQACASDVGYRIDLDSPDRPITYDSRVVAHHVDKAHPALFDHDPFFGMFIEGAAGVFRVLP